jgi:type I restriction enzyme R subunit
LAVKKQIVFTKRQFSGSTDKVSRLSYTKAALLRAVSVAGRGHGPMGMTTAARAGVEMRINALISALNMDGAILEPTGEYLNSGSTDRSHKSFHVGNALCAHAANRVMEIPWLVDFEKLGPEYKIVRGAGNRRPDFLGKDIKGRWFVFEAKGRSSPPGPADLRDWKTQTKVVNKINGRKVRRGIVSAAYLNRNTKWELLWVDPSPDDEAESIVFDELIFFRAYYGPILEFLENDGIVGYLQNGTIKLTSNRLVSVGLHREIIDALRAGSVERIRAFASRMTADEAVEPDGSLLFRDGVMIRIEPELASESVKNLTKPQLNQLPIGPTSFFRSTALHLSDVGKREGVTQSRVITLFVEELGYKYLGDWTDRDGNSNAEESLLSAWLTKRCYTLAQINAALYKLRTEADNYSRDLYENNREVYKLLRYGVQVKTEASEPTTTVNLIDWAVPTNNDFCLAEEVTLKGKHDRRPDLVLYVNGIAIGVIELKRSGASIGEGIRQSLSNQKTDFNAWFFSTVQFVFAGNDSEGLQYGTIGTAEKYFLKWKEDEEDNSRFKLDKYLLKMCRKDRLIELMHDFVLFDSGKKKMPRVHQYFGIKSAQDHVRQKKGGIIWHTQGSGKSIVMVLLAKWILENNPHARVAIITDRDELDKQIERVFTEIGEPIRRTTSGKELIHQLGQATPRLLCSLVHKFGRKDVDDFEAFIKDLEAQASPTVGEVFVFVDECHRTQSGKLHRVMKAMMPNAVFMGFTGTPLLKKDKATSFEVFGGYIHTYKFSEAVADEVVLDLIYEARDIDQRLGSEMKINAWFDAKTKGLNEWQKEELKKKWGTMQQVLSSKSRMDRVVTDIVFDFSVRPRLSREHGNAILVASSIYEACKYFALFQKTPLKGKCAVVTSYNPQAKDVTLEETGANTETDKQFIYNTYNELLKDVDVTPGMNKTETYEEKVKAQFIKEPAKMKLLVVVDKLLTGFDVPPCSYLYIDKSMQDHGLFQAICRTNRLDGDDKDFGYIVDYKDLFKKVENAIAVYTSELDDSSGGVNPDVLVQDRLKKGRERLDNAIETMILLCEPVEPPKGELEHIHYFCGNTELASDLEEREPQRAALYRGAVGLVRTYANIADELDRAGYSSTDVDRIKQQLTHYLDVREIIRKASGEQLDLKPYEADMRHLIDTYIDADEPRKISDFDDMGLLEVIQKTGIANAIAAQLTALGGNSNAISETIENNVRSKIIKEHLNDPAFYDTMSALLDEIIGARKTKAIEYEAYLKRIAEIATKVQTGIAAETPEELDTPGKRALWNNLSQNEVLALKIDASVRHVRPDGWRGVQARELVIKAAIYGVVQDAAEVERIFLIIKAQGEY